MVCPAEMFCLRKGDCRHAPSGQRGSRIREKGMQKLVVTKKEAGWRFDKYLKRVLPQASTGFLYKMMRKKNITLNGKKAAGNEVIGAGDSVEVFFSDETFRKFSGKLPAESEPGEDELQGGVQISDKEAGSLKRTGGGVAQDVYTKAYRQLTDISVIYEDGDILILDKPAGVLSQKAGKADLSLNEWMLGYLLEKGEFAESAGGYFKPSVCNRLDRNTSGLVLCGKSVRGSQFLTEMLRKKSLCKYYGAYAKGWIPGELTLCGYLKKEEEKNRSEILSEEEYRKRAAVDPGVLEGYKRIETVIRPVFYDRKRDCTKLEILLVTGKSHQIRAHLASIGHPVLGDRKYGWRPARKGEERLKSQLLYACRVEFPEIEGTFARLSEKSFEAKKPEAFSEYEEGFGV